MQNVTKSSLSQLILEDRQPAPNLPLNLALTMVNDLRQQTNGGLEIINDDHNDSNKLATDLQEKEQKINQQPPAQQPIQKSPLPLRNKTKKINDYVGFANLPNQFYRRAVKRGFQFTLMVVGASGLGKSTFINSMFLADVYSAQQYPGPSLRTKKTVTVEATKILLKENGVNLTLTVVDTPGFGDSVNNTNCCLPILEYIDSKYEEYLTDESRVCRKSISDNRVHCCLYFIAPNGNNLKLLDIDAMQSLSHKVNLVPVIAKADTLTPDELHLFKKQILNEIAQHEIKIYDFTSTLEDVPEESQTTQNLRSRLPFAVVGANTMIELENGRKIRGRRYPWGLVEVENLLHCDFLALRHLVLRTHMQDLKDVTNNLHYESYRCQKLSEISWTDGKSRPTHENHFAQMEKEKHALKMQKIEAEMEQVFEMKVEEKMQKLKDIELELTRRHEERKKSLEEQLKEFAEKLREFRRERKEWEALHRITIEELKRRSLGGNNSLDIGNGKKEKKKRSLFFK